VEEHALEILPVIAVANTVSSVVSVPHDYVDAPARLAAAVNGVIDELECAKPILRAPQPLPFELRDARILEDSLKFAGNRLKFL
jgi:hypothetical protein